MLEPVLVVLTVRLPVVAAQLTVESGCPHSARGYAHSLRIRATERAIRREAGKRDVVIAGAERGKCHAPVYRNSLARARINRDGVTIRSILAPPEVSSLRSGPLEDSGDSAPCSARAW